jgi:hypothetical protein
MTAMRAEADSLRHIVTWPSIYTTPEEISFIDTNPE